MIPLVSILIPAFNAEQWVADTIRSALAQTWSNKEVIVVDDGSRDDTLAVAKSFESRNCKVLSQENRGASAARNRAFSYAQGEFIQWLDADDLLGHQKVELQLKKAEFDVNTLNLFSCAFCRFYYRPQNGEIAPNSLWQDLSPLEFMLVKFKENLWMNPSSWLVSRKLTDIAGPWNESLSLDDDGEYFCRVVLESRRIFFVPQAMTYKRRVTGSLSSRISFESYRSLYTSVSTSIERVLKVEDSERVRKICLTLLQRLFVHFYDKKGVLLDRMNELARSLGGELQPPRLAWKYSLISKIFGLKAAIVASRSIPKVRAWVERAMDNLLNSVSEWWRKSTPARDWEKRTRPG